MNKRVFIGNCVNGLDDRQFREYIANNATELAQLVENSKEISKEEFVKNCNIEVKLKKSFEYFYHNEDKELYFYRDIKKDIEYFYI